MERVGYEHAYCPRNVMGNMSKSISEEIRLERFFVEKIVFERNYAAEPAKEKVQIEPVFNRKIMRIEENVYNIVISVCIDKDRNKNDLPFKAEATVGGVFRLSGISAEQRHAALGANASSILFPYLRSTISTAMSLAGVPPILLPVMNANKVFGEEPKDYDN